MLEDEKKRATEQAKMLEMDLEVHPSEGKVWVIPSYLLQTVMKEKEKTLQQVEVSSHHRALHVNS